MDKDKVSLDRSNAARSSAETIPAVASLLVALQALNPYIAAAVGMAVAGWKVYEVIAPKRMNELVDFIEKHKSDFVMSVLQKEETSSLFYQLIEQHIRENSERKRTMLRAIILQTAKGKLREADWHTKLLSVLTQITVEEAEALYDMYMEMLGSKHTEESMVRTHYTPTVFAQYVDAGDPEATQKEEKSFRLLQALNSLHSYRLLNVSRASIGVEVSLTEFGLFFIKHVFLSQSEGDLKKI